MYLSEQNPVKCIWWQLDTQSWWIGSCEDVGESKGYAYKDPLDECPGNP